MSRVSLIFRTSLPVSLLLLTAAPAAHATSWTGQPVSKAEWGGGMSIPGHIEMFVGFPNNIPDNAPIVVNIHSCGNNAGGQWDYDGFTPLKEAMDSYGFIMIVPQQSQNCWDVGTTESLTHGGGGDTGAIVQMVKYVIETYNADPNRVYAMGGSGGGMAVQALLAVYPEVFRAGFARAGVTAGCWAESYDPSQQWSGPCAGGMVDKSPQEWGDYVRAINPDYAGPWPRLIVNHGNADGTINFKNFEESFDEWTNLHGLEREPTRTETDVQSEYLAGVKYNVQYWEDECGFAVLEGWEAVDQGHSMGYESYKMLDFFGLEAGDTQDPWDEMCGDFVGTGGTGGTGGGAGTGGNTAGGGTAGAGGAGTSTGGMGASTGGAGTSTGGTGTSTGGTGASTGGVGTATGGATPGVGGAGAAPGAGGAPTGTGGAGAATGTGGTVPFERMNGGCSLGATPMTGGAFPFALLGLGLVLGRRRRRAE